MVRTIVLISVLVSMLICFSCGDSADKKLGNLELEVSCNAEAKVYFKQGLLYLHSFEYLDAITQFKKAQQADTDCGMAYWGEIMSYNHPLFNREIERLASKVLQVVEESEKPSNELFKSEMEQDLYESVKILFGKGTKTQRNAAYAKFYKSLSEKYQSNDEIQAFHALALLGSPINEDYDDNNREAAKISSAILSKNPQHPGALHYLIHANDSPKTAHLALEAADQYSKVAPDATHALHMPSHIYLALGMWDKVISSNVESWNASVNGIQSNPKKEIGYHSLSWLHYGLLQAKEMELAEQVMTNMLSYSEVDQSPLARSYLVAMKGVHMVEADKWTGDIADLTFKIDDLHLTKKAGYQFLEGIKAFNNGNSRKLEEIINGIANDNYIAGLNISDDVAPMCNTAGNPSIPPNSIDIKLVKIFELQLKAKLEQLAGNTEKAMAFLKEGCEIYQDMSISFGPPVVFKAVHESYAELLISEKKYEEAKNVITRGLSTAPGKTHYYELRRQVAEKLVDQELLTQSTETLDKITEKQDRGDILHINFKKAE